MLLLSQTCGSCAATTVNHTEYHQGHDHKQHQSQKDATMSGARCGDELRCLSATRTRKNNPELKATRPGQRFICRPMPGLQQTDFTVLCQMLAELRHMSHQSKLAFMHSRSLIDLRIAS